MREVEVAVGLREHPVQMFIGGPQHTRHVGCKTGEGKVASAGLRKRKDIRPANRRMSRHGACQGPGGPKRKTPGSFRILFLPLPLRLPSSFLRPKAVWHLRQRRHDQPFPSRARRGRSERRRRANADSCPTQDHPTLSLSPSQRPLSL